MIDSYLTHIRKGPIDGQFATYAIGPGFRIVQIKRQRGCKSPHAYLRLEYSDSPMNSHSAVP